MKAYEKFIELTADFKAISTKKRFQKIQSLKVKFVEARDKAVSLKDFKNTINTKEQDLKRADLIRIQTLNHTTSVSVTKEYLVRGIGETQCHKFAPNGEPLTHKNKDFNWWSYRKETFCGMQTSNDPLCNICDRHRDKHTIMTKQRQVAEDRVNYRMLKEHNGAIAKINQLTNDIANLKLSMEETDKSLKEDLRALHDLAKDISENSISETDYFQYLLQKDIDSQRDPKLQEANKYLEVLYKQI